MSGAAGMALAAFNAAVNAGISAVSNAKAYKRQKGLMDYQENFNKENFGLQNVRQDYLNRHGFEIQAQSARNAGLSPLAMISGSNFNSQVGSIGGVSAPGVTSNTPQGPDMLGALQVMSNIDLQKSQANLNDAIAKKTNSETTGQDLTNDYMSQTFDSLVKLTNAENKLKNEVIGLINSNQSLKDAFAEEKRAQVDLMEAQTDVAMSQSSLNEAVTEYNRAMTTLTDEKAKTEVIDRFLKKTQGLLNQIQIMVLKNEDFRKNHENVGYLLTTMKEVVKNKRLTSDEKASMLDILFSCYYNCSQEHRDLRNAALQGNLIELQGDQQRKNVEAMGDQQRKNIQTQTLNNIIQAYATIPQRAIDSWLNYRIWHEEHEDKPLIITPNNNGHDLYDRYNRQVEQHIIDGILDPYRSGSWFGK